MKQLSKASLLRKFGDRTYSRGHDYFDEQRVLSLEVDSDRAQYLRFFSEVQGSRWRVYKQDVAIRVNKGQFQYKGHCSCPMKFNCKHVVAACLEYNEVYKRGKSGTRAVSSDTSLNWLDELIDLDQHLSEIPSGKEFVIYRLDQSGFPGKLKVDLVCTRILKNGGLGKGTAVQLDNLLDTNHYSYGYSGQYVQPVDSEIARLLFSHRLSMDELLIEGEPGYLAINKMINTGRCFWQDNNRPLTGSQPRRIDMKWNQDERGNSRLTVRLVPDSMFILTQPLLYLDIQQHCVGAVSPCSFTAKQLDKLLNAPIIPREFLPEFSRKIVQHFPAGELPTPHEVEVEHIANQIPSPRLVLFSRQNTERQFHHMKLDFTYAGHIVSALPREPVSSIVVDRIVVRIQRDLASEKNYADELLEVGFEAVSLEDNRDLNFMSTSESSGGQGLGCWQNFLDEVKPRLERQGWEIKFDKSFRMQFHQAGHWDIEIEEKNTDWFDLMFKVDINGQPRTLLPLVAQVLENYDVQALPETLHLHLGGDEYLCLSSDQILPVLDVLFEIYDSRTLNDRGGLRLSRFDSARLAELDQKTIAKLRWHGGQRLLKLGSQLGNFKGIESVSPPSGFNAQLRDYQKKGLNWLQFLRTYGFGGVLADDMGLGKTVQTLAHLLLEKQQGRLDKPGLIIAPTSLMSNWRREAQHFTPQLKVLVLQGADRHQKFSQISAHDVVLSTYPLLSRDREMLLVQPYSFLVCDEAQLIKNPNSKAAQILRKFKARHRLCLTGTPMENHLGELWALFDFLMPGFLGDAIEFKTRFRNPIEQQGDDVQRQRLAKRIGPFMLRRSKTQVLDELPEKTQIIRSVSLDSGQAGLYESIRLAMEERVRKSIVRKGFTRSHITILDALLKLRQVCCDPRLLKLKQAEHVKQSAKLDLLMQMLPEMIVEGRRVLLFSQFTQMLSLIESELSGHGISYSKLTGQTRQRDAAIERFQNGEASVFLISLKAGGLGLNLTTADTVIHYDPWWNPAAEDQATDRAHRIGQSKAIFVYKLMVENSVEEKILAMQKRKKELAKGIYQQSGQVDQLMLEADDMAGLFAPL